MATFRQIKANQCNAQNSSGPKTDEGKAQSRGNALTHGMSATVVNPADDAAVIEERLETWKDGYVLKTEDDAWLYSQMIVSTVKIDRCQRDDAELATYFASRAEMCWDDDQAVLAEELAAKLSRRPGLVSKQLVVTLHGCRWLIERWRSLGSVLESGETWTEVERSAALDLLGFEGPMRHNIEDFGTDPGAPETLALIRDELERLEARKERLESLDDKERSAAARGFRIEPLKALKLVRRYEAAHMRRFQAAHTQLRTRERSAAETSTVPEVAQIPPTASARISVPEVALILPTAPPVVDPQEPVNAEATRTPNSLVPHGRGFLYVEVEPPATMRDALPAFSAPLNRKRRRAMEKLASHRR